MAEILNGHALRAIPRLHRVDPSLSRLELLRLFLDEAQRAPFVWGDWDCMMTLARWVERLTDIDPATALRGRYRSDVGWRTLVERAGGLAAVLANSARRAGMESIAAELAVGDVALVYLPRYGGALFGGIYCGEERFVVKTADGLIGWRAAWEAPAWRVPCQ